MKCYDVKQHPMGAIKCDTTVTFSVLVSKEIKNVTLVLIHDKTNDHEYIDMKKVYKKANYDKFEFLTTYQFKEEDLIWYYFTAESDISRFNICKGNKSTDFVETHEVGKAWQITVYNTNFKTPNWIKGSVIYHIFVDRFAIGDKPRFKDYAITMNTNQKPLSYAEGGSICFYGGNLQGIINKLDYFNRLGVNCLYLSPIFEATSNHKYDTNDYESIDYSFGTEEIFKDLCKKAGDRGIRIILDGVFNHVGVDSKYFNDTTYHDWFTFRDDGTYECWWNFSSLPSIKKTTPHSYKKYIKYVICKWLKLGASGWRLDVADELSNELLEAIREAAKSVKDDAVIIGEVWENASNKHAYGARRKYLYGHQLDSVMNYPFRCGIIDYLNSGDATCISNAVDDIVNTYPKCVIDCLMNNIGTHDTARILTELGGDKQKTKLAFLLLFTLPGNPCIYYGDEMFMEGGKDPHNRAFFEKNEENLIEFINILSTFRKTNESLKYGKYELISDKDGIYHFKRYTDTRYIEIMVNFNTKKFKIKGNI